MANDVDPVDPVDPVEPDILTESSLTQTSEPCYVLTFTQPTGKVYAGSVLTFQWTLTTTTGSVFPVPLATSAVTYSDGGGNPVSQALVAEPLHLTSSSLVPAAVMVISVVLQSAVAGLCTIWLSLAVGGQVLIDEQDVRVSP